MSQSLYLWFSSASFLPDSTSEKTKDKQLEVASANEGVVALMQTGPIGSKQLNSYVFYSPELQAKIGKFAAKNGNKVAVEKFS